MILCVFVGCRGRLITGWRRGSVGRMLRPCCRRRGRLRPNCCGPTSQTNCSWPRRRLLRYNSSQNQHRENNSDKTCCSLMFSVLFLFFQWLGLYWIENVQIYSSWHFIVLVTWNENSSLQTNAEQQMLISFILIWKCLNIKCLGFSSIWKNIYFILSKPKVWLISEFFKDDICFLFC